MSADPRSVDRPPAALRAEALEELLTERGLVKTEVLDGFINRYVNDVGPLNGAKVVAKAWVDPDYRERLLADGTGAIKELGFGVHNLVVCTLCSCYPWPVLGLPPNWYKDPAYRSRAVREPRALLAEMGLPLADDIRIRVWDSSAENRYFVLPRRPQHTDGLSEEELAALVTRDAMVGVAVVVS